MGLRMGDDVVQLVNGGPFWLTGLWESLVNSSPMLLRDSSGSGSAITALIKRVGRDG